MAAMEKVNKQEKDVIIKNNKILRQRMGTLDAEYPTEVRPRDCPGVCCYFEGARCSQSCCPRGSGVYLSASHRRARRFSTTALEQALQKEKLKPPEQASVPDAPDLGKLVTRERKVWRILSCVPTHSSIVWVIAGIERGRRRAGRRGG